MGTSVWRRLGAIFLIVVVLGLGLFRQQPLPPSRRRPMPRRPIVHQLITACATAIISRASRGAMECRCGNCNSGTESPTRTGSMRARRW